MPKEKKWQKDLLAAIDDLMESANQLKKEAVQFSAYMANREEAASVSKLKKAIKKS